MKQSIVLCIVLSWIAVDASAVCVNSGIVGLDRKEPIPVTALPISAAQFRRMKVGDRAVPRDCQGLGPSTFNSMLFRLEGRIVEYQFGFGDVKLRLLDSKGDPFFAYIVNQVCLPEHPLRKSLEGPWALLQSRLPRPIRGGEYGVVDIPVRVEGFGYYACGLYSIPDPQSPWLSPITKIEFPDAAAQSLEIRWTKKKP